MPQSKTRPTAMRAGGRTSRIEVPGGRLQLHGAVEPQGQLRFGTSGPLPERQTTAAAFARWLSRLVNRG